MGNRSEIEGYLSELVGKPKLELESGDLKFLSQLLAGAESVTSLHRSINRKYEYKLPSDDDGDISQGTPNVADNVFYLTRGPLSKLAVRKRINKLVRYGLIERVDKQSLTSKERFAFNLRRAKPFRVTEYGLFCVLLQETVYPSGLLPRYWQSKVMSTLLSSYFEKKTVIRLTTEMYFTIVQFLHEACSITIKRLNKIEQAKKENDKAEYQEQIRELEDDLLWHAKSFALRLLVDSAASKKDKRKRSRRILSFLAHDKKFYKLADTGVREILSYYKGGRLLRR
jgi:hypothetical protein